MTSAVGRMVRLRRTKGADGKGEALGQLARLHQLTGLGDAKLLKSLECSIKGRHYRA